MEAVYLNEKAVVTRADNQSPLGCAGGMRADVAERKQRDAAVTANGWVGGAGKVRNGGRCAEG